MNDIQHAVNIVRDGGIIIYPTDTAFGIGCRIDRPDTVERLFALRKRPLTKAMPVLVASASMAFAYFDSPSEIVRRLIDKYWPGALTIVWKCYKDKLYSPIRGDTESVGLRMPNHETALAIIRGVGVPIVGPSANFHGQTTPYHMKDLDPQLMKLVDFVVPGSCALMQPSTVVDCTKEPYVILRQGAVMIEGI